MGEVVELKDSRAGAMVGEQLRLLSAGVSELIAMFPNWWQQRYFLEQAAKAGDVQNFAQF